MTARRKSAHALKQKVTFLEQESGAIIKPWNGKLSIALAFPNTYYVGMSNLGFQIIYRLLNREDDVVCERVFLPEGKWTAQPARREKPLLSCESCQPLASFRVIAFSLSFENDYLNILSMLSLAHIAPLRKDRDTFSPLIIGGGIAASLNPEPLADIFDIFMIGEGEEALLEFLDVLREKRRGTRWEKPHLEQFAHIKGIYVPSLYNVSYHRDGTVKAFHAQAGFPEKIQRRWVKELNNVPGSSCITTPNTEFASMPLIEVSRGCPRTCRFCVAQQAYRPYRIRSFETVQEEVAQSLRQNKKVGLLGAAVSDHPALAGIIRTIAGAQGEISISSLRVDTLTEEVIALLKESGHKTFTLAPEAGSERLRQVISKDLSNAEIFKTAEFLARHKISQLRLYFLVGLPTEDTDDIAAIGELARRIKHAYLKEARSERQLQQIVVSLSVFIPKPWTPFQWHPFAELHDLKKKLKTVLSGLKKENKVIVTHDLPKWGYVQVLLSRGDRRTSIMLLKALASGGNWTAALKEVSINPDFYVYRKRAFEEIFPWDFIDYGLSKETLWQEYQKALR